MRTHKNYCMTVLFSLLKLILLFALLNRIVWRRGCEVHSPGIKYCILTASSFSRSRRKQMAAHENKMEEIKANPTPIHAIMYDQS